MSAQSGIYVPLQKLSDIRLLALMAGQPDDPIESVLLDPMDMHARDTLEETADSEIGLLREYKALSYVWGDQNDKRLIFVNGQPFWVTYNLFSLLSRVRDLSSDPQCLWVDAVWFVPLPLFVDLSHVRCERRLGNQLPFYVPRR